MKTHTEYPPHVPPPEHKFRQRPFTRLGRWAVALTATFIVLFIINSVVFMPSSSDAAWRHIFLPFYGIAMLLVGFSGSVMGLVAIVRQQERSWMVWLTLLPGAFVLFLLLGEFLVPH